MRKLLVSVLIFVLLGCSTEQKVDENMKLSDYLERVARGDKLNSMEVQQMKMLANEMEEKVSMWSKDGQQNMTIKNLKAQDAFFTNMPNSFISMYQSSSTTIATNTWTTLTSYSDYEGMVGDRVTASNDFFELDTTNGRIYIKQTGRAYAFYVRTSWSGVDVGYRSARIYMYKPDGTEFTPNPYNTVYAIQGLAVVPLSLASIIIIPWGNEGNIGDYVTLKVYQNSGGDLDVGYYYFGAFVLR